MEKSHVSDLLEEIAELLELKGENPCKARAYVNAARALDSHDGDLAELVAQNRLGDIPGIGEALRLKITEIVQTGRLDYYEKLRASVPAWLLELSAVPGVSARMARTLHDQVGISNGAELKAACQAHRVRALSGFGPKSEEKILAGLTQSQDYASQYVYAEAWTHAEGIREELRQHPAVGQISLAGSLRRGVELVKNLDLVASSRDPAAVLDYFVETEGVKEILSRSETAAAILFEHGISARLHVVSETEFACALHHFTGSREHNAALRAHAQAQGKELTETQLLAPAARGKKKSPAKPVACRTEDDLFAALDLQPIPPELREGRGEIEAAAKHSLPRLIEWTQLRGTFHCHTNASDGKNTLAEMADHARELGLEYLGIADHSKSSIQANGLTEDRLLEQIELVRKYNAASGTSAAFHLFAGSEVDILKDGRLDFEDDLLAQLDYVVASVHNLLTQDEAIMTARIIRAMENEHVTMLGHVTGRRLLQREPSKVNFEKIIDCAAATGTWIELNCSTWRMDMDWRCWHHARDKGVKCVINPDAHRTSQFATLRHGVTAARKGWLRREDVMNTKRLADIRRALK